MSLPFKQAGSYAKVMSMAIVLAMAGTLVATGAADAAKKKKKR